MAKHLAVDIAGQTIIENIGVGTGNTIDGIDLDTHDHDGTAAGGVQISLLNLTPTTLANLNTLITDATLTDKDGDNTLTGDNVHEGDNFFDGTVAGSLFKVRDAGTGIAQWSLEKESVAAIDILYQGSGGNRTWSMREGATGNFDLAVHTEQGKVGINVAALPTGASPTLDVNGDLRVNTGISATTGGVTASGSFNTTGGSFLLNGVAFDSEDLADISGAPNAANGVIQLTAGGIIPVLNGSNLTNVVGIAHTLGGASHTSDTLANLNAKISDATLIDTGDARLSDERSADAIATTGADVNVDLSGPPSVGQVLEATSATTAVWTTPSGGAAGTVTDGTQNPDALTKWSSVTDEIEDSVITDDGAGTVTTLEKFRVEESTTSTADWPTVGFNVTAIGKGLTPAVLQGNYIYVGNKTDSTLLVLDYSNPDSITQVSSFAMSGIPQSISVNGDFAYVSVAQNPGTSRLEIVNISNPSSLSQEGVADTGGAHDVRVGFLYGCVYYMTNVTTSQFHVIDVADPANPFIFQSIAPGFLPTAITVRGSTLLVSTLIAGTYIATYSVVDALNPVAQDTDNTGSVRMEFLTAVMDGYAFGGATSQTGIHVIDFTNPTAITATANVIASPSGKTVTGYTLVQNLLYVLYQNSSPNFNTLAIYDVTDPFSPVTISEGREIDSASDMDNGNLSRFYGNRVIVTNVSANTTTGTNMYVVEAGGLDAPGIKTGSIYTEDLSVRNSVSASTGYFGTLVNAGKGGLGTTGQICAAGGSKILGEQISGRHAFSATADTEDAKALLYGYTNTTTVTFTLQTSDTVEGRTVIINDEGGNAGTNNITIATQGAQTINGSATATISSNYGTLRVYSDGTNWFSY